ncbi:MAG: hypothetical protein N3G18_04645 [Candidatus Saccharicenans sp.]|nr:hypothetical protein [Candidatus Saccharicenans sp.]
MRKEYEVTLMRESDLSFWPDFPPKNGLAGCGSERYAAPNFLGKKNMEKYK